MLIINVQKTTILSRYTYGGFYSSVKIPLFQNNNEVLYYYI